MHITWYPVTVGQPVIYGAEFSWPGVIKDIIHLYSRAVSQASIKPGLEVRLDQLLYFTKWQKVREGLQGLRRSGATQVLSTALFPISFVDSGSENEDDWEEMGDEEQENSTICLFCEECFRNADNIWSHCVTRHGVDILKITRMHSKHYANCMVSWFYFSSKPAIYNNMFLKQKNNVYIVEVHLKV